MVHFLAQELLEVASQAVTAQQAAVTYLEWPLGRKLPVKQERVRAAVQLVSMRLVAVGVGPCTTVGFTPMHGNGCGPMHDRGLHAHARQWVWTHAWQ